MKKIALWIFLGSILAVDGSAANLHWVGAGGSGVGDFNVLTNWEEDMVPGDLDMAAFNNSVNKNWVVTLNSDVTNAIVSLIAPSPDYETLFIMNQHVWTATDKVTAWEASGGRITFTNGTLRAMAANFSPDFGTLVTNLVLTMKDVISDFKTMQSAAATMTFEGGRLQVLDSLTVGKVGRAAATLRLDKGVQCDLTNTLYVGSDFGATGELVNVNGELRHSKASASFVVGRFGCGTMTLSGGSTDVAGIFSIGTENASVGTVNVVGGSNTFGRSTTDLTFRIADLGKGTLLVGGGTNSVSGTMAIANSAGGQGEMRLTNGVWNVGRFMHVGYGGVGTLNVSGGEMYVSGTVLSAARYANATGTVSVSGGLLRVNGALWLGGTGAGSLGRLILSGDGVLWLKTILEKDAGDPISQVLFDGGTLKAAVTGILVDVLDDVRLTANGMVVDTDGYAVSVVPELQNAEGEAGGITKKGKGTLTLSGARTATGPVSVLGGTLVMNDNVTVSDGISRIDGTLTLPASKRLTVESGAALAGTGIVERVTLENNAVFARNLDDGATAPLNVSDCVSQGHLTVALSGYELSDLLITLPLLKVPTASFVKPASVSVMRDGVSVSSLGAKYTQSGGFTTLSVVYNSGTVLILL